MVFTPSRSIKKLYSSLKIGLLILFFSLLQLTAHAQNFITTWQTDNAGSSNDTQINIPTTGTGYNYTVVWTEVGNPVNTGTLTNVLGAVTIDFPSAGTYRVEISGQFPRIYFNAASFRPDKDSHKLLTVEQWGNIAWTSMAAAFSGCVNLGVNASDAPNLSGVTDLSQMFYQATSFNDNINHWDVSTITHMSGIFREAESFNQPLNLWNVSNVEDLSELFYFSPAFNQNIGNWDVSSVTDLNSTFGGATAFNQDISSWVISNVTDMSGTFAYATSFNQDIGGWDVSNVNTMSGLFSGNTVFNQDISGWDLSSVENMNSMFSGATGFTQDISGWDVSNVKSMISMFHDLPDFNQDIGGWNVGNVDNMNSMFDGATSFNRDISGWDVSSVTDMNSMFSGATAFNQSIGSWNVTQVSDMRLMFNGATAFNQDISNWNIINVRFMFGMLDHSGLSLENYDNLLAGWSLLPLRSNVTFGASTLTYCSSEAARQSIITNFNWNITDAGSGCITVYAGADISGLLLVNSQPSPFDFGSINAGATKARSFTIENNKATPITNVVISITGSAFTTSATPLTIPAGGTATILINLSSAAAGIYLEDVSITSDDFSGTFEFPVIGVVTATPQPEIVVKNQYENQINDGDSFGLYMGEEFRGNDLTSQITITNLGSAPLDISDFSFTGTAFSLGTAAPISIAIDNSITLDVILSGATADYFYETLSITSNDTDETIFDFGVGGYIFGPEIYAFDGDDIDNDPQITNGQPTAIDFGSSSLGIDVTRTIALTNYGSVDLLISSISISGTAFSVDLTAPIGIAQLNDGIEDVVLMNVTLSGATGGTFNEILTIVSDDDTDPIFQFPITGTIVVGSCVTPPTVSIGAVADICENSTVQLTATIGGSASSIAWTASGDGSFNDASLLNASYTPGSGDITSGSVDFIITTNDPDGAGPCVAATASTSVLINRSATVAAGTDQTSCNTNVVMLAGTVNAFASNPLWSSNGTGAFSAPNTLTTNYTPSVADIATGSVIITLTVDGEGVCSQVLDQLLITILKPIVASNPNVDINIGQPTTIDILASSTINPTDVITVSITQNGTKGVAILNADNTIGYTANSGTFGADLIRYTMCNQCSLCSDGEITLNVLNEAPVITASTDPLKTIVGQPITIPISSLISDVNDNIDFSSLKIVNNPTSGASASFNAVYDLTLDYSNTTFAGVDLITIEVCDFLTLCTQLTLEINVEGEIIVYNGISPNGDGKNDYFMIENIEVLEPDNVVNIFNRWGDKVYSVTNYDNDNPEQRFNGVNNNGNELTSGVYFYQVEFLNSDRESLSGYLTIRN